MKHEESGNIEKLKNEENTLWREINELWDVRENHLEQLEKEYKNSNITQQIEILLQNLRKSIKEIEAIIYDVDGILFNAHAFFVAILQQSESDKREHLFLFSKEEILTFFDKIFDERKVSSPVVPQPVRRNTWVVGNSKTNNKSEADLKLISAARVSVQQKIFEENLKNEKKEIIKKIIDKEQFVQIIWNYLILMETLQSFYKIKDLINWKNEIILQNNRKQMKDLLVSMKNLLIQEKKKSETSISSIETVFHCLLDSNKQLETINDSLSLSITSIQQIYDFISKENANSQDIVNCIELRFTISEKTKLNAAKSNIPEKHELKKVPLWKNETYKAAQLRIIENNQKINDKIETPIFMEENDLKKNILPTDIIWKLVNKQEIDQIEVEQFLDVIFYLHDTKPKTKPKGVTSPAPEGLSSSQRLTLNVLLPETITFYVNLFFTTKSYFITPTQLLEKLIYRFCVTPGTPLFLYFFFSNYFLISFFPKYSKETFILFPNKIFNYFKFHFPRLLLFQARVQGKVSLPQGIPSSLLLPSSIPFLNGFQ